MREEGGRMKVSEGVAHWADVLGGLSVSTTFSALKAIPAKQETLTWQRTRSHHGTRTCICTRV